MIYEVYVDGASRGQGNPETTGHGAAAALIYKNKKLIGQYARGLGRCNNHQAEYEAILMGLLMCWSADLADPVVYSDCQLVVNQISGKWQCNNDDLKPLLYSVREIEDVFRFRVVHVPRSYVAEADQLANNILDQMLEPRPNKSRNKRSRGNVKKGK